MHAVDDRLAFAPPPQPGLLRAFGLAVVAHVLLAIALTQGLQWQRETENVVAEAELWSALPQQAAPREETPVPPPLPTPVAPTPPVVKAPPLPDPQVQRDAEIALEREREKRDAAERRQAQLERERDQKRKLETQKKRDEELARRKEEQAQRLAEAARKEEQAQKLAEAKRKEDDRKRRQQEQEARDAKRLAQLREENMRRMQGMAGTGAPSSTGTAAQASGPSAGWGAKVQARVRPNIVFTDDISGNPAAEVEVRTSPDGTIVGKRLVRPSGSKAWDDAVLRALDKTESLPRDVDGRVPSPVTIRFRPQG
ncbi:MAG TPA: cell envelope integrity protein TolA [Ramlibacter sp.]|nr:cell envelope integrity protein TolA [Ramlibacter sp.]